ncbi:U4 tri-snRNP-associated 1 [Brachionus plicatilis]|uniref:U4 tri-snRNP-associated 1 n=1 Tax=Brachionus plicatilis TaxID=10195 RepID=A0A3M7S2Q8_BRAPC|nr:U4 tri-snRNP-associated 1 [Brachionus plicatilis]
MESKKSKSSSSRSRRRSDSSEDRSHKSSSKRKNHSSDDSNDSDHDERRHRDRRDKKDKKPASSKQSRIEEAGGAAENLSLSIEETNKLRAKLGLKPLSVDDHNKEKQKENDSGKKTFIDKDTNQEFEHAPAKNLTEVREQKEFKQKLDEQREKRRLAQKIRQVKSLGEQESDSDSESADVWVQKLKQKQEAAKKAKLLEEMDEQFLTPNESVKTKKYTSSQLKGLRIEHDQAKFREGEEVILTLKDKDIIKGTGVNLELDEDEDTDVLVNVNLVDDERASQNVENKKKKPDYKPYEEFDEEGNFRPNAILDKYDAELNGEQKKFFKLGAKGMYDASDDKFIQKLEDEHKSRAVRLDILNELREASDYMTAQEMEKFKKPKKIRKGMRKNKSLKAADLLPMARQQPQTKVDKVELESAEKKINLDDFDFKKESSDEGEIRSSGDESDIDLTKLDNVSHLKEIMDEENQLLDELQTALDKTRKRVTNKIEYHAIEAREELELNGKSVLLENLNTVRDEEMTEEKDALTLDTISEFCRGIGAETRREDSEMDMGSKKSEEKMESDEEFNLSDVEAEVENEKNQLNEDSDEDGANILDDEPIIDRGIGAALKLAVNKGYLANEKDKQFARVAKSSIEAKNYTIEERNYYDIDDKYKRSRDKFCGPLVDFEEKKNYKPDIKLDYYDEKGHAMNEKEAFRYLSHKFHGKGPGKKKTEKRLSKFKEKEAMNKMSSVDTPLHTVELLIEKQKNLQQPFVVLSAPKGKQEQ